MCGSPSWPCPTRGFASAFDRYMSTMLGHAAVEEILSSPPDSEPKLVGIRQHDVIFSPLMECVTRTQHLAEAIAAHDYQTAMAMRGGSFADSLRILRTLLRAHPIHQSQDKTLRLALLHCGGPAPGMNTACVPPFASASTGSHDAGHSERLRGPGRGRYSRDGLDECHWLGLQRRSRVGHEAQDTRSWRLFTP